MLPNAPTAASGVRKVGIKDAFRMRRASPTVASPIRQVSSGLLTCFLTSASASAMAALSMPILGEKITRMPSTSGALPAVSTASLK